ncbi:pantetheine-phosphate adenylyltransferase [Ructibacterium gallinarum]|uniref:Phosphopantetheine adenylyltransferase n=1 Tax=Ructibacterium gallinarum TaxID=2779355 RepID=A0A9D5M445_9FIRM|nr:pantetheine-phosphate adenylyltransferase [Ructibacterium gallinarum]MBE5040349.1 pantetheine-phosphate adenylyltransferase [Ructibacterium gallinarum]
MKTVVYPGSFDPCTNGHLDVIARSAKLFDRVIVAVLVNHTKKPAFTVEERVALLKTAVADLPNVEVHSFSGLLVDFMKQVGATVIIKGIRAMSDFEYEFQMALTNHALYRDIETLFIPTSKDYMFLSSSIVKEIAKYGGPLNGLVPEALIPVINKRCAER